MQVLGSDYIIKSYKSESPSYYIVLNFWVCSGPFLYMLLNILIFFPYSKSDSSFRWKLKLEKLCLNGYLRKILSNTRTVMILYKLKLLKIFDDLFEILYLHSTTLPYLCSRIIIMDESGSLRFTDQILLLTKVLKIWIFIRIGHII